MKTLNTGTNLVDRICTVKKSARKRPSGRPTANQSRRLRETLMSAALHSFMKRGYESSSLESIARDAKVAKITIYRRFGGKAQLFREVVHYAQTNMQVNLRAVIDTDGTPEVVLRKLIGRLRDASTHPDYLAVLRMGIAEAPRFPNIAFVAISETDYALGPLIEYLHKLDRAGLIVVDDVREAAIQFTGLAVGGVRFLMAAPSNNPAARSHWIESIYTLFARAWGLMPVTRRVAKQVSRRPQRTVKNLNRRSLPAASGAMMQR